MNIWYKLSLICGLTPLVIGCLIFFSWWATRAEWLMFAGIYNITAGLAFFFCGLIFLFIYGKKECKTVNAYPIKRSLIALGILLFNFPAAALAVFAAEYIMSTSTVTVINNSRFVVTDLILIERDQSYGFPPIAPGQQITENLHLKHEGSVDFKLSLNGSTKKGQMFIDVVAVFGESATMVIQNDGAIEVTR